MGIGMVMQMASKELGRYSTLEGLTHLQRSFYLWKGRWLAAKNQSFVLEEKSQIKDPTLLIGPHLQRAEKQSHKPESHTTDSICRIAMGGGGLRNCWPFPSIITSVSKSSHNHWISSDGSTSCALERFFIFTLLLIRNFLVSLFSVLLVFSQIDNLSKWRRK